MSQQSTNEVHIYVVGAEQKNIVRKLLNKLKTVIDSSGYDNTRIYSISWEPCVRIHPNNPTMQHLKPMVNLKELQEIVLLISLGIPTEEAISTITKQGYDS